MGKLVIYTGPMKGGKTTALLTKYNEEKCLSETPEKIMLFKPEIDDRFSKHNVITRNGKISGCNVINSINDILKLTDVYEKFFIDEFQFLNGDVNKLIQLSMQDKEFYIAGLNLTAERKPFGLMYNLFPYATEINILYGNCDNCGAYNKGIYTYYKGGKTQDIIVGEENYMCVCHKCYDKLTKHTI